MVHIDFSHRGIQSLDLSSSSDDDQHAKALSHLTSLDLSHNELVSIKPSLATFVNLRTLNLAHNMLKQCPQLPPQVEDLNLEHNLLSRIPHISSMNNLQSLNLNWNQLMHLPMNMEALKHLVRLDISHNHLKTITSSKASLPPNLTFLDISYNEITKLNELNVLAILHSLNNLQCEHNPFMMRNDDDDELGSSDIYSKLLHICPNLETLNDINDEEELRRLKQEFREPFSGESQPQITAIEVSEYFGEAEPETKNESRQRVSRPSTPTPRRVTEMLLPQEEVQSKPLARPHTPSVQKSHSSQGNPTAKASAEPSSGRRRYSLNDEQIRQLRQNYAQSSIPQGRASLGGSSKSNPSQSNSQKRRSMTPQPTRTENPELRLNNQPTNNNFTSRSTDNEETSDEKPNQLMEKYNRLQRNYKNLQSLFKNEKSRRLKVEEELSKSVQQIAKFRIAMKKMKDDLIESQRKESIAIRDVKILLSYLSILEQNSSSASNHQNPDLANLLSVYSQGETNPSLRVEQSNNSMHSGLEESAVKQNHEERYTKSTESYNMKVKKRKAERPVDSNFNNTKHLAGPGANQISYQWETSLRTANPAQHPGTRRLQNEPRARPQRPDTSMRSNPDTYHPTHIPRETEREIRAIQRGYDPEDEDPVSMIENQEKSSLSSQFQRYDEPEESKLNLNASEIMQLIQKESMELTRRLSRSFDEPKPAQTTIIISPPPVTSPEVHKPYNESSPYLADDASSVHSEDDDQQSVDSMESNPLAELSLNLRSIPANTSEYEPMNTTYTNDSRNSSYFRARDNFSTISSSDPEKHRREESVRNMFKLRLEEERRRQGLL